MCVVSTEQSPDSRVQKTPTLLHQWRPKRAFVKQSKDIRMLPSCTSVLKRKKKKLSRLKEFQRGKAHSDSTYLFPDLFITYVITIIINYIIKHNSAIHSCIYNEIQKLQLFQPFWVNNDTLKAFKDICACSHLRWSVEGSSVMHNTSGGWIYV